MLIEEPLTDYGSTLASRPGCWQGALPPAVNIRQWRQWARLEAFSGGACWAPPRYCRTWQVLGHCLLPAYDTWQQRPTGSRRAWP